MARKPETTWEMLNVAMTHFQSYIDTKRDRFSLSIVDLLYVSNFKGGNASITEPEPGLSKKLARYEEQLRNINSLVSRKKLGKCGDELNDIKTRGVNFLRLISDPTTKIRGFGASYASALLFALFPQVMPVLDRRILNGSGIPHRLNSQGQVERIDSYYGQLIVAFHKVLSAESNLSLRQLDKRWFCVPLPKPLPRAPKK